MLGAVIVVFIGSVYATETIHALHVRSITGSEFATYVADNHIGQAVVSDDASGFQDDFCVLTLEKPIPNSQLQAETLQLMYQYHNLDGGTSLSIVYDQNGKQFMQADAIYNPGSQSVTMELNYGNTKKDINQHVDWDEDTDVS